MRAQGSRVFGGVGRVSEWPKSKGLDTPLDLEHLRRTLGRPAAVSGGFTLVEVLVALAIVAVALAAGMRAAAGVVDGAQRQADVSAAQWCADNQLTALKLSRQLPGLGTDDFSCEQLGRTYKGTLRTQPTPNPNFRRVEALVRGEDGQPLLTVSTIASRF